MNNGTTKAVLSDTFEKDIHDFRLIMNALGVVLSFVGYGLMVLTAILFPIWRKCKQNQLWLHMCGTFIIYFCMHFYTYARPIKNPMISIALEHVNKYVIRVSLCWMLAGAWLTYKNLVDVFSDLGDKFISKTALFSYITPMPFVLAMYLLYIFDEHGCSDADDVKIGCNSYRQGDKINYTNLFWLLTCIFDNGLLVVPNGGSLILYICVTVSICRNRKVHGQERDLVGTVALGFYFVFTCCIQCGIITAKFVFALTGIWSYVTVVLMSLHVSTYTILFIVCNKLTREMWWTFLKSKISKKIIKTAITNRELVVKV